LSKIATPPVTAWDLVKAIESLVDMVLPLT